MKRSQLFFLVAAYSVMAAWVSAKPPEKPRLMQYSRLWTNSPFTIKPARAVPTVVSPLEREWSLGSIRPSPNGYSVTLINKKNRKERVRFIPGYSSGAFKLLEVKQNVQSPKQSKVLVSKGGQKGWITYDEKIVALRAPSSSKGSVKKTSNHRTSSSSKSHTRPPMVPPLPPGVHKPTKRVRYVPRHK